MNTNYFPRKHQSLIMAALTFCGTIGAQKNAFRAGYVDVPDNDGSKKNVLFIVSDDLCGNLGCFDDPQVKTPNLDRLRQHAVRFNSNYCQFPLSGPSRASILTGFTPDRTHVMDLMTRLRNACPEVQTLPELFKDNGYVTARVGKVYHAGVPGDIGSDGHDDTKSWHVKYNPLGADKTDEHKVINFTPKRGLGSALAWMEMDVDDDTQTDAIGANMACSLIRRYQTKPFFIAMGFYRPHTPYIAPKKYFDMYPLNEITLPEVPADDWKDKPIAAAFTQPLNWNLSDDSLKIIKRAYYASISFLDAQVGKLLDTLDELDLTDNTIIVFCSDHGYNLGQHGQWMKSCLFEQTTRTPLIISAPGITTTEGKSEQVTEMVDIFPTVAELCNLTPKYELNGKSMVALLKNPNDTQWNENVAYSIVIRKAFPEAWYPWIDKNKEYTGRSIRTNRYRYTEWNNGQDGGELYDYQNDPNEYNNLYNNKKYKKLQAQLKAILDKKIAESMRFNK